MKKGSTGFLGGIIALGAGSFLAQAIGIVTAPILSRLFDPEAFGIAAAFTSFIATLTIAGSLTYHLAIVLPKEDDEAANILALCVAIGALLTVLLCVLFGLCGATVLRIGGVPELEPYKWWVPIGFALSVAFSVLLYWNTRCRRFKRQAAVNCGCSAATVAASLTVGGMGFNEGIHLIGARLLAMFAGPAILCWYLIRDDFSFFIRNCRPARMVAAAERYRKFPMMIFPSALVSKGSQEIPTMMFMPLLGAEATGLYAIGKRLLMLPVGMISDSIAQVFLQRASAAHGSGEPLGWLVEKVSTRLITLSLLPAVVIALTGTELFQTVFGKNWEAAGPYASLLTLGMIGGFVGAPLSQLFVIMERQTVVLSLNMLVLASRLAAVIVGGYFLRSGLWAVGLLSGVGLLVGLAQVVISFHLTQASAMNLLRHVIRQVLYVMPSLIIVGTVKWGFGLSGWYVVGSTVIAVVPCCVLILRHDRELWAACRRSFDSAMAVVRRRPNAGPAA